MAHMATISSKGQMVIPAALRNELGLKPGARVRIRRQGKGLHVEAGGHEAILALRGKYAGLPLEEDLAELRRESEARLEAANERLRS